MSVHQIETPKTGNGAGQHASASSPFQQSAAGPPALPPPQPTHWGARVVALLVLLAVLGGGTYGVYYLIKTRTSAAQSASAKAAAAKNRPVPIIAAAATTGDQPIYRDGPGTAQALNTVVLHTRVDGELTEIHFTEGQHVQKGDVLAVIDRRPYQAMLDQANGQLAKDQATLTNAQHDLDRYKQAGDAVPKQQLDTAQSTVNQLTAALKIDQAQIENAALQLSYCTITAPISGRIGLRNVDVGNIVHATDSGGLATITQLQPITVVFTLGQADLPSVLKAMKDSPAVPVLAYDTYDTAFTKPVAKGKVLALDNQIDLASGTFRVKAEFSNGDEALYPNQFVNCRILVDTLHNVVLVPAVAIQQSPTATFVYVIGPDKKAAQRDVTVGPTEGSLTVVEKGLKSGEMIATEGLDRLEDGTQVILQSGTTQSAGTRGAPSRRSGNAASGPADTPPNPVSEPAQTTDPSARGGNRGGE